MTGYPMTVAWQEQGSAVESDGTLRYRHNGDYSVPCFRFVLSAHFVAVEFIT